MEAKLPGVAKFAAQGGLPDDALKAFLKIADQGATDAMAERLAKKVMAHKDVPGVERWTKLASRQLNEPGQLRDLEQSLDDAIKLRPKDAATEMEVYYEKGTGRRLTNAEAKALPGKTVNVDVETSTMRREHKRVNVDIKDDGILLDQVKEGRSKFNKANLTKGAGGKRNIVVVDYGAYVKIPEADALAALKKFIGRDALLKKFVDEVIVTINGVEHVLPVP